jgi:hypothetical protein
MTQWYNLIPHNSSFLLSCLNAIRDMRRHGMNDTLIACIIQDIRSATLNEEFRRCIDLVANNPPKHHHHGEIQDAMKTMEKEDEN